MRRARIAILSVLGVLLVLAGASMVRKRIVESKKPPARQDHAVAQTVVDAVAVSPATLSPGVVAYGMLSPSVTLPVVPEVGGRVVELARPLRPGTIFHAGDLLWQVDPRDHELAVQRVEAEIQRLQATSARLGSNRRALEERSRIARELLDLAKADVERYQSLAQRGAASKELLDRARATQEQRQDAFATLKGALASSPHETAEVQAQLADARVRLELAKLTQERTRVVAPFDGRVLEGSVEQGIVLGPGKPAVTLEDTSSLEVHVPFTLRELGWAHIVEGAQARVRAREAAPGDPGFEARYVRIDGPMDERTQTQTLVFRIDGADPTKLPGQGGLSAGMFVAVELPGRSLENAVEAPRRAVREDGTVAVVIDDKLAFRKVEMVRQAGDKVFLQGALAAGDLLVVNPPRDAVEGALVKIRGAASSVAVGLPADAEAAP